jgi:hypothetical protein
MTYLHPRSFGGPQGAWEWNDAGTRLVAVHRKYRLPNGRFVVDERIPVDDLFMVVWDLAGENWEGVSLLRSMYRSWVEKDMLARIGMIDAQNRGVGIPDVELSPTDTLADQRSLVEIAKSLRGGSKERAFVVRANGQKVGFLTSTGAVVDTASMIMQRNNDIASAASTDFMQQGQTQSGSRATGSVLMVSYMQELDATRQFLEEQINHGAGYLNGLIEDIMAANFPGAKKRPRIESSRVSPTEQLDNVPNILDAVQKGGLVHDLEVENHVRKALGVKELTQNEFDDLKTQNMPPNLGGRPSEVRDPTQDSSRDDEASSRFRTPSEKKTLVGRARPTNRASWDWLQSNGD